MVEGLPHATRTPDTIIMYADTHCHLTFEHFDPDRAEVITNAKKAGVKRFVVPGTTAQTSRDAITLASLHRGIMLAAIGIHPYEASDHPDTKQLDRLITPDVGAIGECGLDYHLFAGHPAIGKKEEQKQLLESQLLIALARDLPVIIHCRDAYDDIFGVLDALPAIPRGVFHCFAGGLADYREVARRGMLVGFDGNVTYSKQLSLIVPHIPLSSILLETDAPYLTPTPMRGERNEPKYIPLIAKRIAELTNATVDEVANRTTDNALRLFWDRNTP